MRSGKFSNLLLTIKLKRPEILPVLVISIFPPLTFYLFLHEILAS